MTFKPFQTILIISALLAQPVVASTDTQDWSKFNPEVDAVAVDTDELETDWCKEPHTLGAVAYCRFLEYAEEDYILQENLKIALQHTNFPNQLKQFQHEWALYRETVRNMINDLPGGSWSSLASAQIAKEMTIGRAAELRALSKLTPIRSPIELVEYRIPSVEISKEDTARIKKALIEDQRYPFWGGDEGESALEFPNVDEEIIERVKIIKTVRNLIDEKAKNFPRYKDYLDIDEDKFLQDTERFCGQAMIFRADNTIDEIKEEITLLLNYRMRYLVSVYYRFISKTID